MIIILLTSYRTNNVNIHTLFTEVPKDLHNYYAVDMINDEPMAEALADLILKNRGIEDLSMFKPYYIKLIHDNQIWNISTSKKQGGYIITHNLNINKNTGEIANYWVDK